MELSGTSSNSAEAPVTARASLVLRLHTRNTVLALQPRGVRFAVDLWRDEKQLHRQRATGLPGAWAMDGPAPEPTPRSDLPAGLVLRAKPVQILFKSFTLFGDIDR